VQSEEHWHQFCATVCEHPEWEDDPHFVTASQRRVHRDVLERDIEVAFSPHSREEITRRLDATGIPYGEVRSVSEFIDHPQLAARDRWKTVTTPTGPIEAIVPGFDLEGMEPRMDAVPGVGEQTDEILTQLGYDAATIAHLREDGVV
jgi:formyl-CoA transferase